MLDWLNDSPGFPVSVNAENQNREAANPHGYAVFPVSRFPGFKMRGRRNNETKPRTPAKKIPRLYPNPSRSFWTP